MLPSPAIYHITIFPVPSDAIIPQHIAPCLSMRRQSWTPVHFYGRQCKFGWRCPSPHDTVPSRWPFCPIPVPVFMWKSRQIWKRCGIFLVTLWQILYTCFCTISLSSQKYIYFSISCFPSKMEPRHINPVTGQPTKHFNPGERNSFTEHVV